MTPTTPGRIIVLNGASSAGKSTIIDELSRKIGPCVVTGLDDILERSRPFGSERSPLRALRILFFQLTDDRLALFRRLHREIAAYALNGQDVLVETALMEVRALRDAAECFAPLNGWFIGVKPPLEVSEAWEASRTDRPAGQARRHYDLIHAHNTYDLTLDPSSLGADGCAAAILSHIASQQPSAFSRLSSR
jgi:chloramphenicol 3-O phosphotransferase